MHGERKHGELRRSGDRSAAGDALQAVAELSSRGVALCDAQGYCRYANLAFQRLTGYDLKELRSSPIEELLRIHPLHSHIEGDEKRFTISRKDGNPLIVCGRFVPLEGEGARVWLVQLQADLSQSAQRSYWMQLTQRLAAEAAGIGFWEWDMTNDVCTVCPVAAAILELPPGSSMLVAEEWQALIVPEDLPLVEQTRENARRCGGHFKLEFRQRRAGNQVKWLATSGMLQCDALGQPLRAVGILQDVSERKRTEALDKVHLLEARAIAEADAKFRTFFYQSSYYAGLLALDGTLLEVNLASLIPCGYTEREVIGRKFWLCAWWHGSRRMKDQVRRSCMKAAKGKVVRREITYFMADGEERISDMTLAPVTDDAGRVLYVAATGWDITERKQSETALRASEERYRLLSEMSPDAIVVERQGQILYANSAALRLFAASDFSQLVDRTLLSLLAPEHHEAVKKRRTQIMRGKSHAPLMEVKLRRLDEKEVEAHVVCGSMMWGGQPAIQVLLRDVSEIKKARAKLHRVSERLRLAIEGTGEGIWDWDIKSDTIVVTGGLNRLLGDGDTTAGNRGFWKKLTHPEDVRRVEEAFRSALEDRQPVYECEYRLRDKEGNWRWIWARGVTVERDAKGRPLTMTGTLSDITVRKESADLAWRHANLDALTDLPNRRLFRERLELELARTERSHHSLALLFIDLDGFKQVNDAYGHDAGDALLMETSHRLQECVRKTDIVARLGGDEFTVILTELDHAEHVEFVCQKILEALAQPFFLRKEKAYVTGSIGVSLYPLDSDKADELIRKADQAMYSAKHSGKNQFHYFTQELDDRAHQRLHITNELRHALQSGQLEVHYQPVLDLRTGRVVKAEALLRWQHPVLGEVGPAKFIPLAEESGLIRTIGDWVFREAALCSKQCGELVRRPFQIGVNKSPSQFMAREAENNWVDYLGEIGLSAQNISVEITEGVLLNATSRVINRLSEYKDAGIQVALDDFGTGYSSMAYLQKFNIDYVKIDQSFVRGLDDDEGCLAITEAIITMAHKLGKKVIAEGIETPQQKAILMQAGCDYGQGFLFSRAVPAEQLMQLLVAQPAYLSGGRA